MLPKHRRLQIRPEHRMRNHLKFLGLIQLMDSRHIPLMLEERYMLCARALFRRLTNVHASVEMQWSWIQAMNDLRFELLESLNDLTRA